MFALAPAVWANGVMGYALEQYDGWAWLAYVLATVVFEAWAIGKWAGFGWPKAVGVSIAANLITAGCCANLCGVGLHQNFVGSRLNPNPLANMALMFLVFGALSGGVEAIVWRLFGAKRNDDPLALRAVAAHLAWVPIGMAIMLVPAHPYPMLEAYTIYARRMVVMQTREALETRIAETDRIPDYRDTRSFFREMTQGGNSPPDAWAAAYRPNFTRFATGVSRDELLWEWNPAASGLKLDSEDRPQRIWLIRMKRHGPEDATRFGLILDGYEVSFTADSDQLGYPGVQKGISARRSKDSP